jgi:hypothetical protein
MRRRQLLHSLAALPAVAVPVTSRGSVAEPDLLNPYEGIDWDSCDFVHSMSHQHQGQTEASRQVFHGMGYRHFAFSNYYPSAPTYPLPEAFASAHPKVIAAPNSEQHSFTDSGLHFNALGSMLATGYGSSLGAKDSAVSPLRHRFENLNVFDDRRPWLGVYRLDIRLAGKGGGAAKAKAMLNVQGAVECAVRENYAAGDEVRERELAAGNHSLHLRTTADAIDVQLSYDTEALTITQFRLMQGTNRPWRDVFRAALDGEAIDGRKHGGLLFADGGGITLNHPTGKIEDYLGYLDFDKRVLGIEVWNQLTSGFGSNKGFYDNAQGPHLHFYRLWDDILRTGRRCWGFFVKDHNTYGRGRNVLLLPTAGDARRDEREAAALRAYRNGCFFGSVAALAVDDEGKGTAPFDHSEFRFTRIEVKRDANGRATAIHAAVAGNDAAKRPNVQIRFITDQGTAAVTDGAEASFALPRTSDGKLAPAFVRIEAFAYPGTHLGGVPMTAEFFAKLNVFDISQLHDRKSAIRDLASASTSAELRSPTPIVDMIFSQPLLRV